MYNLPLEKKLKKFEETCLRLVKNPIWRQHYQTLMRSILTSESLSEEELLKRAEHIKPLVRLRVADKGAEEEPNFQKYVRVGYGEPKKNDLLVWTKPLDIHSYSYLYSFDGDAVICNKNGTPLKTGLLIKVAEFTGYHSCGYYGILRPSVDEVLQQIPVDIDLNQYYAFELQFLSDDLNEIYDGILNRHISKVILYHLPQGLPEPIRQQPVLYKQK